MSTFHYFLIFVGEKDLKEWFEERGRLRSVFGESIELNPLKIDEFKHAVKIRLDYNSISKKYVTPFDDDIEEYFFKKSAIFLIHLSGE